MARRRIVAVPESARGPGTSAADQQPLPPPPSLICPCRSAGRTSHRIPRNSASRPADTVHERSRNPCCPGPGHQHWHLARLDHPGPPRPAPAARGNPLRDCAGRTGPPAEGQPASPARHRDPARRPRHRRQRGNHQQTGQGCPSRPARWTRRISPRIGGSRSSPCWRHVGPSPPSARRRGSTGHCLVVSGPNASA